MASPKCSALPGFLSSNSESEIVVITNLNKAIGEDELKALINLPITSFTFENQADPHSKCAKVQFGSYSDAKTAVSKLNGQVLLNHKIQAFLGDSTPEDVLVFPVKVTHLSPSITELALYQYFQKAGEVIDYRIYRSTAGCYGRVNFRYMEGAQNAVRQLNGGILYDQKINVSLQKPRRGSTNVTFPGLYPRSPSNEASTPCVSHQTSFPSLPSSSYPQVPVTVSNLPSDIKEESMYPVKVTHLPPSVTEGELYQHFQKAGKIIDCRIHESRYAHVNFRYQDGAQNAVDCLNGSVLHKWKINVSLQQRRKCSTSIAFPSPSPTKCPSKEISTPPYPHETTSPVSSGSVKVSNLPPGVEEEDISKAFISSGKIHKIKIVRIYHPPYAYVNFYSVKDAERACESLHGTYLEGRKIKVTLQLQGISSNLQSSPVQHEQETETEEIFRISDKKSSLPVSTARSFSEVTAHVTDPSAICGASRELPTESTSASHNFSCSLTPPLTADVSQQELGPQSTEIQKLRKRTIATKQPHQTEKAKPTTVYVSVSSSTTISDFHRYLGYQLRQKLEFQILQLHKCESHTEVQIQFTSINKARLALRLLKKCDPGLSVSVIKPGPEFDELKKRVDDFKKSIEVKRNQYVAEQQVKLDELMEKQKKLQLPKRCTLDQHQAITAERAVLTESIQECRLQLKEFESRCDYLYQKLNQLESSIPAAMKTPRDMLTLLRKHFGIECVRFHKALPIYAHRQFIVEVIKENQVSILIGETGSGKSTQLVQYLHDAGFTEKGLVACTQPRKVAAVTLANHVSTAMCVKVGTVVGYKCGMHGKYNDHTRVLYMTDHTLLNECIADPTFSRYSCLVIDEAHERSLHTDTLLAFIKQCLSKRKDLKVIITSATIDPQTFIQYFGECPVVKVPGRTYPVDVTWNPLSVSESPIQRDYVSDAIQVACQIHKEEPAGDILVFLTSPGEIERACQTTNDQLGNTATVLPLHGKLQPEEQQKVFKDFEERKIVFATNVAETSVTIPGVKYIVDTGLAKELCFDPKRNMNSLEVRIISKSSAEQRKGRAGRTSPGKCYRLYSEDDYKGMPSKMLPEILRVALTHTALKLYEFGIANILTFEFVEQPDSSALQAAIESLQFLGAIRDDQLTDVGRKMAAFPIDPHLVKILLDAIHEDIGVEAAAAVAISVLAGSVFFRAGTDEMKKEGDKRKLFFCHPAGDQMTYLSVYHQWLLQKKNVRNQWCVENYINAKSMRMIEENVKEFREILDRQCAIKLPTNTPNLMSAEAKLPKLYFNAFIRNICVFLGHERVGYMTERLPGGQLVIFPASSLRQLNLVPKFLIYEKTLRTSQHFLLQLLPVKDEWVQDAIESGSLPYNPAASKSIQKCMVSPITIPNLGQYILKHLRNRKTRQDIEKALQEISTEVPPVFDFENDQGILKVFVPAQHHEQVSQVLKLHVSGIRDELEKEQFERGVIKDDDIVRVVVGLGGSVQYVLMPHEYRTVIVKGPVEGSWEEQIIQDMKPHGCIQKHNKKIFTKESRLYVTFSDPGVAKKVITSVQTQSGVVIEPQLFYKHEGESLSQFTLKIEWCRRERQPFAFITFSREEDLTIATSVLIQGLYIRGSLVKCRPSRDGSPQLFLPKVSLTVSEEDIKNAVNINIPYISTEDLKITLGLQKSFETTPKQHQALNQQLDTLIATYATKGRYHLNLLSPERAHHVYRAFVTFQNPEEGQATLNGLQSAEIGGKQLNIKPSLSSSIRYSPVIYTVVEETVKKISSEIHDRYESVKVKYDKRDKWGNVIIRITSDNVNEFVAAKTALNSVILPHTIECSNPTLREYLGTMICQNELEQIQIQTSTCICTNFRTMTINMYGTEANLTRAKIMLNETFNILDEGRCYEIPLKAPGMPPGVMKQLVSQYGHSLQEIVEMEGVTTARLDPQRQILTLLATSDANRRIRDIIAEFLQGTPELQHSEVECCACFTGIESPSEVFRLEYCGHTYCLDCVQMQVAPLTITFPVKCAADDCSKPFVWKDFENLFRRTNVKLRQITESSLKCYIGANKKLVHNCPTPDCSMVYKVSLDGKPFFCYHCGITICTKCHEQYHDGLTCEMYQSGKEAEQEFKEWLQGDPHNRKCCPNCTTPIEKIEGCNYMFCTSCQSHVCWVCLQHFTTSQKCHAHLATIHGGFM